MNIPLMDKRVKSLEEMMADLMATVENTSRIAAQTSIEMKDFKDEMRIFRDESRSERRNFNKQLGEIANKQGRMTEDLVAPSICRILQEVVDCPSSYGCGLVVRIRKVNPKDRSRTKEFDAIAECGDYVLVNETKSSLASVDIDKLMDTIAIVREYFPEYKDRKIIGSLATLYVDESLVKYASRKGIIVLAVGEELMDIVNEPGFKPAEF
jgi:hypothetical protein